MADKSDDLAGRDDELGNTDATPDLNALAKEYLDLWQQQLAETARDGTLAKTMSDAVRLMSAGAAHMAATMPQPPTGDPAARSGGGPDDGAKHGDDADGRATDHVPSAPGSPAAGTAHRDDDGVLDELHRRVAELEERIGVLERRVPKKSRGPR